MNEQLSDISKENVAANDKKNFADAYYERDKDPERLKRIAEGIENTRRISIRYEGENIQLEYIEVPAKEKAEGKEKVIIIIPGFSASYIPFTNTVKELAQYMGDHRVICLSPLDSGNSSSLKDSSLKKMNEVYLKAFEELNINSDTAEATVVGHSRSDIITLELARSHPEVIKNIALVNGVSANENELPALAYNFLKHINVDITPTRIAGAFQGETEAAKNYWRQNVDFMKNISHPVRALNQFKSLAERRKINLDDLLAELKANVLVLSGTSELTDYQATRKNLYAKLPEGVKKQHRIEAGGLHDEINAHPEAFALKLKRWLESQ